MALGQKTWLQDHEIDSYDSIQCIVEWETSDGDKFTQTLLTNWIDPESLSVDEGTMGKFGGETAYTVAGETYSGDPRRKVDWAGGIPTEDKATTILDAMKMKLSDNPAYSDTKCPEVKQCAIETVDDPCLWKQVFQVSVPGRPGAGSAPGDISRVLHMEIRRILHNPAREARPKIS